ncbi:putative SKP1-like protein 14-like [Capsicum annuum]|nr:putative SKP1-like protein 14-like [Capsicum annuum]
MWLEVMSSSRGENLLQKCKWGISGTSSFLLATLFAGVSILLNQGIDIRANISAVLGLAILDAILLGGSCLAQISSFWPPYKRRICVHEAGHLLIAYLMICPIRGVILDPIVAMQMGIQGQAGTQFWDEKLENKPAEGRLSGTAFDRYCMVLFAGIAAEALIYGEAEGGENDENLFRSISVLLEPTLSVAQVFLWLKMYFVSKILAEKAAMEEAKRITLIH